MKKKLGIFIIFMLSIMFVISTINFISNFNPEKLHVRSFHRQQETIYLIEGNKLNGEIRNTKVVIPKKYEKKKGVLAIAQNAFYHAKKLEEVTLTSNTKYINENAFMDSSLNKINIPKNCILHEISTSAFENTNIFEIYLPDSLKIIKSNAFKNTNLTSIYIPKSVDEINFSAFKVKDSKMTIYFETENIPEDWMNDLNGYNYEFKFNVSRSDYDEIIKNNK